MKKKKIKVSDVIFGVFVLLLIVPQTRKPIMVVINKARVFVMSPSVQDDNGQKSIQPFSYRLTDLKGNDKHISVGEKRVVFLSYWATWCPPCIAELPSIQELYSDYGEQMDFILLTHEKPEVVNSFLLKEEYDLPVFFPRMKTPDALYAKSIPTNYVIDGTGKIVIKETGAVDWSSEKVRNILDELIKN
ncbi:TlpA family protein disulfide reductase [Maribacter sp. 2210JD10-5]|uniref:TlpA family protein disulfide reductase n=1 Tax=Maribacter sp. 2210JD10-5 TaxID=3386272 RepID=UPI0039BCE200